MSASAETDDSEIDFVDPPKNDLTFFYYGFREQTLKMKKIVDVEVGVTCKKFFELFFDDKSNFLNEFHASRGDIDIKIDPWSKSTAKEPGKKREVAFTSPGKHILGPKTTRVFQTQKYAFLNKERTKLVMHFFSTTPEVPFGDSFRIEFKFKIIEIPHHQQKTNPETPTETPIGAELNSANSDNSAPMSENSAPKALDLVKCQVVISVGVRFSKTTRFQSVIEEQGVNEGTTSHVLMMEMIQKAVERMDPLTVARRHSESTSKTAETEKVAQISEICEIPNLEDFLDPPKHDFSFFFFGIREEFIKMHKVADAELNGISCKKFFDLFFGDKTKFLQEFHLKSGDIDISVGPWSKNNKEPGRKCELTFMSQVNQLMGPKTTQVKETLKYVFLNKERSALVIYKFSDVPYVPYGDTFRLEHKYKIQDNATPEEKASKCHVTISVGVRMLRSSMFSQTIELECIKEATKSHATFIEMAQHYATPPPPPKPIAPPTPAISINPDSFDFFKSEGPITMHKAVETAVPVSCSKFFDRFFADGSTFSDEFHKRRGDSDIVVGPWTQSDSQDGQMQREVRFAMPAKVPMLGSIDSAKAVETQKCVFLDTDKTQLVIHTSLSIVGLPFADTFTTEHKFIIQELPQTETAAKSCFVTIFVGVRILKSSLFQDKIEKGGLKIALKGHVLLMYMVLEKLMEPQKETSVPHQLNHTSTTTIIPDSHPNEKKEKTEVLQPPQPPESSTEFGLLHLQSDPHQEPNLVAHESEDGVPSSITMVQTPPEAGQKIETALKTLSDGAFFAKVNRHGKRQLRFVFVDFDNQVLVWSKTPDKKAAKSRISLPLKEVVKGWPEHIVKHKKPKDVEENHCFCLVTFGGRVLELQAHSPEIRDEWAQLCDMLVDFEQNFAPSC